MAMANWMTAFLLMSMAALCLMLMGTVALLGSQTSFQVTLETYEGQPGVRHWRLAVGSRNGH